MKVVPDTDKGEKNMAKNIMSWDKAILKVMEEKQEAMFYYDIATAIVEQGLRPKEHIGKTPPQTVNRYLNSYLKDKVVSTGTRGEYILASLAQQNSLKPATANKDKKDADDNNSFDDALITAFGRYWDRKQFEQNCNQLYGASVQYAGAESVDFSKHAGIYLLHKGERVVYVGQATHLVDRLSKHIKEPMRTRWDSFSWFSIIEIKEDDENLNHKTGKKSTSNKSLLDTLEALLIEVIGPELNKQAGNGFAYKEYEQIDSAEYYKRQYKNKSAN